MFRKGFLLLTGVIVGLILFAPSIGLFSEKVQDKELLQHIDSKYLDLFKEDQSEKVKEIIAAIGNKIIGESENENNPYTENGSTLITDQTVEAPNIEEAILARNAAIEKEKNNSATTARDKGKTSPDKKGKSDPNEKNTTQTSAKKDKHLNKKTDNTNLVILGVDKNELEVISIYSINERNKKSAGVFLSTQTALKVGRDLLSLEDIYNKYGARSLKNLISKTMEIDIPYYMEVDKRGLVELSDIIGSVYVDEENVDVPNLFTKSPSSGDDAILQGLAKEVTKVKIRDYPKLLAIFKNNVQSDLGVQGVYSLYKIFKNLNHAELSKIVLGGEKIEKKGERLIIVAPYDWHNMIYQMTQ